MMARRLTIGIDASRALKPRRTGTERYAFEIIRHLLTTPEGGDVNWRLYVPEMASSDRFALAGAEQPPGSTADVCVLPQRRMWTHRSLAVEVTMRPPDVLFVPAHVLPWQRPGIRLPPSVVTIHDIGYHYFPEAHTQLQRAYLEWSTAYAARHATRLVAVSEATARDLQKVYGARPEQIRVVYEAATPMGTFDTVDAAKTLDDYAIHSPYALFLGTLQPRKNLVRLLEAYALLRERKQAGFQLVLAGADGWMAEGIHAAIVRLDLAETVRHTGPVDEVAHAALFKCAQFFVFPSLFEGFGLPVLEAQQAGVPVMTANNSSLPEIAGDAAILVDPLDTEAIAQAMLQLSTDETLRQRLIEAGYENVKRFSWANAAAQTLAVLREAAQER